MRSASFCRNEIKSARISGSPRASNVLCFSLLFLYFSSSVRNAGLWRWLDCTRRERYTGRCTVHALPHQLDCAPHTQSFFCLLRIVRQTFSIHNLLPVSYYMQIAGVLYYGGLIVTHSHNKFLHQSNRFHFTLEIEDIAECPMWYPIYRMRLRHRMLAVRDRNVEFPAPHQLHWIC